MQLAIKKYINNMKLHKDVLYGRLAIALLAAVLVVTAVFWSLKLTGVTLAGDAFCGKAEHRHGEACLDENGVNACGLEEHVHTIECYSDINADRETAKEWEASVSGVSLTGDISVDLAQIAKSQLGYKESEHNYRVVNGADRKGYTRYGAWYGNEYGDWSAMFVSFCLEYADFHAEYTPISGGSEALRVEWSKLGNYVSDEGYQPIKGDIVFLDKNGDGSADAVAVVNTAGTEGLNAIEGDVDNKVSKTSYSLSDEKILGYGSVRRVVECTLSDRQKEVVAHYNEFIANIPEPEAVELTVNKYESRGETDACAQYIYEVGHDASAMYNCYWDTLNPRLRPMINNFDKIIQLSWTWQSDYYSYAAPVMPDVEIMEINGKTYWYGDAGHGYISQNKIVCGGSVADIIGGDTFDWWVCYVVQKDVEYSVGYTHTSSSASSSANKYAYGSSTKYYDVSAGGIYYISNIIIDHGGADSDGDGTNEANKNTVKPLDANGDGTLNYNDGFLVFVHWSDYAAAGATEPQIKLYDSVATDNNLSTKLSAGGSHSNISSGGAPIGYLTFGANAQQAPAKNNGLSPIEYASTKDFVEINLYNYDANINNMYRNNIVSVPTISGTYSTWDTSYYPGFQRPSSAMGTETTVSASWFQFGDMLVENIGTSSTGIGTTRIETTLNALKNGANDPLGAFGAHEIMYPTLVADSDGNSYPAVKNGSGNALSLKYLFSTDQANGSTKLNSQNIDGLFQLNPNTGLYWFNCRTNHAYFNQNSGNFELYNATITPNFIQYPFGNFMPTHNINTGATPVYLCNYDYFQRMAAYLYRDYFSYRAAGGWFTSSHAPAILQTARAIDNLNEWMLANGKGSGNSGNTNLGVEDGKPLWIDYLVAYFETAHGTDSIPEGVTNINVSNLYNIDYNVQKNFWFGMDMHMEFYQPHNGMVGPNDDQEMQFQFAGDDDVWIYIDGVLVLDLSGIHRHVGGTINFATGAVKLYSFNFETSDADTEIWSSTLKEIYTLAGKQNSVKWDGNTFVEYSSHTFDFYYIERGSGSSVCQMGFNLEPLEKGTISIEKETVKSDPNVQTLGNPWYLFQVVDPATDISEFGEGVEYSVLNAEGIEIEKRKTLVDGVVRIRAGETAVFHDVSEDIGEHCVRELISYNDIDQYKKIYVDNILTECSSKVAKIGVLPDGTTGGTYSYRTYYSVTENAGDGSTIFSFKNEIDTSDLAKLQIQKTLKRDPYNTGDFPEIDLIVKFDGEPIPVGWEYTIEYSLGHTVKQEGGVDVLYSGTTLPVRDRIITSTETKTVTTEGVVTVPVSLFDNYPEGNAATLVIKGIIGGSEVYLRETDESSHGYVVSYLPEPYSGNMAYNWITLKQNSDDNSVSGLVRNYDDSETGRYKVSTIRIHNQETHRELIIPFDKTLIGSDNTEHSYTFKLEEVTGLDAQTLVEDGISMTTTLNIAANTDYNTGMFKVIIPSHTTANGYHYYRITEAGANAKNGMDTAVYVVAMYFFYNEESGEIERDHTVVYKNGERIAGDGTEETILPSDIIINFTNREVRDLIIEKAVEHLHASESFGFELHLTDPNGAPLTGSYVVNLAGVEQTVELVNGTYNFRLKGGEKLTFYGIPYASGWNVTEDESILYYTKVRTDANGEVMTNTAGSTLINNETVVFVNTYSGTELPSTGSYGNKIFIYAGLLIMAASLVCGLIFRRKRV